MLDWSVHGAESGDPVVYFHGTPASKDAVLSGPTSIPPDARLLACYRPGYGRSAPCPRDSLLDVTQLALNDLSSMGVDRFSVIGWSGGGPYALACAALAPERTCSVCLLGSWAPMTPPHGALPATVRFAMRAAVTLPRPFLRLIFLMGGQGQAGMADDVRRVAAPWGFEIDGVAARTPVFAWHCSGDPQVPIDPWRHVDGVHLTALDGQSHEISKEAWEAAVGQAVRSMN